MPSTDTSPSTIAAIIGGIGALLGLGKMHGKIEEKLVLQDERLNKQDARIGSVEASIKDMHTELKHMNLNLGEIKGSTAAILSTLHDHTK